MRLPLYQIDAFADKPFSGNPAAIVPLTKWLDERLMQAIAAENNLAETAFFLETGPGRYDLRWFTPTVEVDLCGHATLASAYVVFTRLDATLRRVDFKTRSGILTVARAEGGMLAMDFPAIAMEAFTPSDTEQARFREAIGGPTPRESWRGPNLMFVFDDAAVIPELAPTGALGAVLGPHALICTAPAALGSGFDFVSRFFAPNHGIAEDPVTGSAHCALAPYWARRLKKSSLVGRQQSARGGTVWCEDKGARVLLKGRCAFFLAGEIAL